MKCLYKLLDYKKNVVFQIQGTKGCKFPLSAPGTEWGQKGPAGLEVVLRCPVEIVWYTGKKGR